MCSIPVFAGLDYHQDSVQVCVLDQDGNVLANRSLCSAAGLIDSLCRQYGEPEHISMKPVVARRI